MQNVPKIRLRMSSVVVAPGGGNIMMMYGSEGFEIAERFNDWGAAAFVLTYRLSPKYGEDARILDGNRAVQVVRARDRTVLGDVLVVKAPAAGLAAVAQLACVQMIAVHAEKKPLNDLSRVKLRISTNAVTAPPQSHYAATVAGSARNLTGQGVLVAVADTGFDDAHPDLAVGRVVGFSPDFDGHGTHVIGSLLGNGSQSPESRRLPRPE